jgi:Mrp family chromosome partitioning ATPase
MPTNPADFLTSTEMRILLKVVGDRFDHVVIDSPPAISFADASIVATLVDGVVIVAHGDRTSRRLVRARETASGSSRRQRIWRGA